MAENERQAQALPKFATVQDEADFWDTHDSTEFLGATEPVAETFVDARPTKQQISLRLEPAVIEQLKKVARTKGVGYQTMIRMWVMERLEQVGGGV
jgi:predicted DNA binding CopG/RHH family protein